MDEWLSDASGNRCSVAHFGSREAALRALGHADLATTERYAHVADAEVLAAMQKVVIQQTSKGASPANIVRLSAVKTVR